MDVRVGPSRKLHTKELMLLNCGVGEDSWEPLGQQEDQTSQISRKSIQNIPWKVWCWSWSSNTLATFCEELTHRKDPDAGKDWRQEEKGTTEDEMVSITDSTGDDEGQGSLRPTPFSFCLQSFPASRSFLISQFFPSGGQSIGPQHQSFQWTFRVDFL